MAACELLERCAGRPGPPRGRCAARRRRLSDAELATSKKPGRWLLRCRAQEAVSRDERTCSRIRTSALKVAAGDPFALPSRRAETHSSTDARHHGQIGVVQAHAPLHDGAGAYGELIRARRSGRDVLGSKAKRGAKRGRPGADQQRAVVALRRGGGSPFPCRASRQTTRAASRRT